MTDLQPKIELVFNKQEIEKSWEEGTELKEKLIAVLNGHNEDSVGFAIRYLLYEFLIKTKAKPESRRDFFAFVEQVTARQIDDCPAIEHKNWAY